MEDILLDYKTQQAQGKTLNASMYYKFKLFLKEILVYLLAPHIIPLNRNIQFSSRIGRLFS